MKFTDLVPGDVVFVDANIFVYHFAPDPVLQIPCGQFLQRIEGPHPNSWVILDGSAIHPIHSPGGEGRNRFGVARSRFENSGFSALPEAARGLPRLVRRRPTLRARPGHQIRLSFPQPEITDAPRCEKPWKTSREPALRPDFLPTNSGEEAGLKR